MKKHGILHRELAALVASLGHGDAVVVGDSGLPVPKGVQCIDLAVTKGVPGFLDVLDALLYEMVVERAEVAKEMMGNASLFRALEERLAPVNLEIISHNELKGNSQGARVVIRTGEWTPYANIVLYAGVAF